MNEDEQKKYFSKEYAGAVFLWSLMLVLSSLQIFAIIPQAFSKRLSPHEFSHIYISIGIMSIFVLMSSIVLIYYHQKTKKDNLPTSLFWKRVGRTICDAVLLFVICGVLYHI